MKAKSIKGNSASDIQSALKQSMSDGFRPTLAIVFISIKQDRKAVCEILHGEGIDVFGATSSGEFIDGYQGGGSIVVLLLNLNRNDYTILIESTEGRNLSDTGAELARKALQKFKHPAFIVCSTSVALKGEFKGEFLSGKTLMRCIVDVVGPEATIFGGMAGDDMTLTGTYVFTHEHSTDLGIAALVFNEDRVALRGMAMSGWKPLGTMKTVTKSEDGWLYTIDGHPALDMYLRYLGKQLSPEDEKRWSKLLFEDVAAFYPFQVEDVGDPIIRTPVKINRKENAIQLDFPVPVGTKLQFCMPPDFEIVEEVLQHARELKNACSSDAEALLIFSCAGRLSALGPMTRAENDGLHEVWGAPMAGFFTYGEYGRSRDGKHLFHSTTCCYVALTEKHNA